MPALLRPTLLCLLVLMAWGVAPASAAIPIGGAAYRAHDHSVEGRGWHIDARVASDARQIDTLLLYAEQCGGHTPVAEDVVIGPVGEVSASGPVNPSRPAAGSYAFDGRFITERRLEGRFRFTKSNGCDTGDIAFLARTKAQAHDHDDEEEHSHHTYGHPMGTMPDLAQATPRAQRQAERLWRGTVRAARRLFPTIGAATTLGYRRTPRRFGQPVLFHMRKASYDFDGVALNPWRPESLVYYWPGKGEPIIVAFMYRQPVGRVPRYAAPLLAWHSHTHKGSKGRTQMTHVWLTNGLRSALANCLPVYYLENALEDFRFRAVPTKGAVHESAPCPARR